MIVFVLTAEGPGHLICSGVEFHSCFCPGVEKSEKMPSTLLMIISGTALTYVVSRTRGRTWRASVLSFKTCSVERIVSQHP